MQLTAFIALWMHYGPCSYLLYLARTRWILVSKRNRGEFPREGTGPWTPMVSTFFLYVRNVSRTCTDLAGLDIFGKRYPFYVAGMTALQVSKNDHNAVSNSYMTLELWGSRPFNDVWRNAFFKDTGITCTSRTWYQENTLLLQNFKTYLSRCDIIVNHIFGKRIKLQKLIIKLIALSQDNNYLNL